MRFLLPATGIIVLIATGYAIQFHLSSNHAAEVETKLGVSVPSCRQTGHEDAAGVRGTSSIAGAVADWSEKITAESPVGAGREGLWLSLGLPPGPAAKPVRSVVLLALFNSCRNRAAPPAESRCRLGGTSLPYDVANS